VAPLAAAAEASTTAKSPTIPSAFQIKIKKSKLKLKEINFLKFFFENKKSRTSFALCLCPAAITITTDDPPAVRKTSCLRISQAP
jgi:hypothetical protein